MKSKVVILLLLLCSCGLLYGQATSYKMEITQKSLSKFFVKLDISLQNNYCEKDTVEFSFGGLIPMFAVRGLKIKSEKTIPFVFDQNEKIIKICKNKIKQGKISFEYKFNIIWGISQFKNASLFYNSLEYPIPYIENIDSVHFTCKVKKLKNFSVLTDIQKKSDFYTSELINIDRIAFVFLDTAKFTIHNYSTPFCEIKTFTTDSTLTENDFNRLGRKLTDCIKYFSTNITPCRYKELNIIEIPWYGSTYIGNVAIVDKSVFKSYTLFHEIIHEWIGGIITIKENSKGELLVKESLNDYFTMQYLKYEDGDSLYNVALQKYKDGYNKYLETNEDISIFEITKYAQSTYPIIMYKQVILLDELAQKIGYDKFNNSIFDFLKSTIGRPIEASEFLDFLKEQYGQDAVDYCNKI
jgi:hypothetical protein